MTIRNWRHPRRRRAAAAPCRSLTVEEIAAWAEANGVTVAMVRQNHPGPQEQGDAESGGKDTIEGEGNAEAGEEKTNRLNTRSRRR
jgi:hypothetical protein